MPNTAPFEGASRRVPPSGAGRKPLGGNIKKAQGEDSVRKLFLLIIPLMLVACSLAGKTTSATAPTATPTVTPTETPLPHTTVDSSTMSGKVIFGYQGWFGCLNDGSYQNTWVHWFRYNSDPTAANLMVDLWPDVSELSQAELCPTDMHMADGSPAVLFSNYNERTVLRHFQWMAQYGIDGVAIQRFVSQLSDPNLLRVRNQILQNEIRGAEMYGRVFYIEYCFESGLPANFMDIVQRDWADLVDNWKITDSPAYLHDHGKPVVELWGFGVKGATDSNPEQAQKTIDIFHQPSAPQYQAIVIGGVPSYWRTLNQDSETDAAWTKIYRSYDVLNPWAVGRYENQDQANVYLQRVTIPDLKNTAAHGQQYMPVIFPGFSWSNLFPGSPANAIPRKCGKFYWRQAYNVISAKAPMIFVAMFDEVDEGTAMFKLATTKDQLPMEATLVPLDADGCNLPSDWYLRLGGETGKMLRGEISITQDIPIQPGTANLPKPGVALTPLATPTLVVLPPGSPFTGTWQGTDPTDGSTTTLSLVQAGTKLTGTFSDTFSLNIKPPGFQGKGSGIVLSASTAEITFILARWDGMTARAGFRLTLSNENNTLTMSGGGGGPPMILQRQ